MNLTFRCTFSAPIITANNRSSTQQQEGAHEKKRTASLLFVTLLLTSWKDERVVGKLLFYRRDAEDSQSFAERRVTFIELFPLCEALRILGVSAFKLTLASDGVRLWIAGLLHCD
jgi:hypothetical protein